MGTNTADYLARLMQLKNEAIDENGNSIDLNRPIVKNPDNSFSTERSITIQHGGLNNGKPTNIPTIWDGKELSFDDSIKRAIQSRGQYPSFNSIDEAVGAAEKRSAEIGRLRGEEAEELPGPTNGEDNDLENFMRNKYR